MSILRQKTAPVREKRIGALSAWSGTLATLATESASGDLDQRVRTYAQDMASDVEHALELLQTIEGLAIVVHGPAGCASALHKGGSAYWTTTNLNERDSIMGADVKLRKAILDAHRLYAPKAIAVVATPVVAINNDDIDTVVENLREELALPVFAVWTDGFRSKVGSTGQDVAVHALAKNVLPLRRRAEGAHVDILSIAESRADIDSFRALLQRIGVESVVFPRYGSIAEASKVAEARASVALDPDTAEYSGLALEDSLGIPFVRAGAPVGIEGTGRWLRTVAALLGLEAEAETVAETETARLTEIVRTAAIEGTRVYVSLPPSQAFAFLGLARELGLLVVGIKTPWIASRHGAEIEGVDPETPVLVGEGQFFEEANLLERLRPDLYIATGAPPVHALRLGIPVLDLEDQPILGWSGVERIALGVERALANTSLSRFLAEDADGPYDPSWLKKSIHWYIKHEVK